MSKHLSMGAVDAETGNHIYPAVGQKGRNYKCPECKKLVIFKHGSIKVKHFAHKANSNCTFYEHPNESQIHREAKKQMCALLNNKGNLTIQRHCLICPTMKEYKFSEFYTETSLGKEEHRFDYNNSNYSADVALLDNGNILLIIEIHETNRTNEDRRPEPWVEVEAIDVINRINGTNNINCIRRRTICDSCVQKQIEQKKQREEQNKKWIEQQEKRKKEQAEQEERVKRILEKKKEEVNILILAEYEKAVKAMKIRRLTDKEKAAIIKGNELKQQKNLLNWLGKAIKESN
jgi:hypothetical protein